MTQPYSRSFAQPHGPSASYGPPPYRYRDARTVTTAVRFDAELLMPYIPPRVKLFGRDPIGLICASTYPDSGFGPYRELSIFVDARLDDVAYLYSPLMYADSDAATAAGRELWGFAKKVGHMTWDDHGDGCVDFAVERPVGNGLVSLQFRPTPDGPSPLAGQLDAPTMTFRLIPSVTGQGPPDVAQLVSTRNAKSAHVGADGSPAVRKGEVRLDLHPTPEDPLEAFVPVEIIDSWMTEYDCLLPAGEVVLDYTEQDLRA